MMSRIAKNNEKNKLINAVVNGRNTARTRPSPIGISKQGNQTLIWKIITDPLRRFMVLFVNLASDPSLQVLYCVILPVIKDHIGTILCQLLAVI